MFALTLIFYLYSFQDKNVQRPKTLKFDLKPTLKNRNSFKSNLISMKIGTHVELIILNIFASCFDYLSLIVFKIKHFKDQKC